MQNIFIQNLKITKSILMQQRVTLVSHLFRVRFCQIKTVPGLQNQGQLNLKEKCYIILHGFLLIVTVLGLLEKEIKQINKKSKTIAGCLALSFLEELLFAFMCQVTIPFLFLQEYLEGGLELRVIAVGFRTAIIYKELAKLHVYGLDLS